MELNSTQGNPVIDSETAEVYFCSNFQAASFSMAMDKTRRGLQMIGKLLFRMFPHDRGKPSGRGFRSYIMLFGMGGFACR
ncbi:hypothetical protein N7449_005356 [Penicillium cf. viridicatum]|uniref:Uncharacterized protein n=1 Tax=Penicillium cf. viridicatum TaxID=2972119 RepID=A0A9W9ML58_9EURO|nr:hypothetical protein N7449_005356 [Penicillium cf. viridicatum]